MFRITELHPLLQKLYTLWLNECRDAGLNVIGTISWRAPALEDELHAEGVTPATSKTCEHCHILNGLPASRAFDFAAYDANDDYIKNGTDPAYTQAGRIAEKLGLVWGRGFPRPDYDHIQLAKTVPDSDNSTDSPA